MAIAILVALLNKKAFFPSYPLPLVTAYRYINDVEMAINTYYRVDEILSGCCLALLYHSENKTIKNIVGRLNTPLLFIVLIASANNSFDFLNYFRPYLLF